MKNKLLNFLKKLNSVKFIYIPVHTIFINASHYSNGWYRRTIGLFGVCIDFNEYVYEYIEICPKCDSIFIQYNETTQECYCLEKKCNHRWKRESLKNIKNSFLKLSVGRINEK